jgi:hypothetical protein
VRRRPHRQGGADTAPTPVITTLSLSEGIEAGGEALTITGTGFRSPGRQFSTSYVTVGASRVTSLAVVSDTELSCVTPAGSGEATVFVTTPGGTATLAGAFTFIRVLSLETGGTLQTEAGPPLLPES